METLLFTPVANTREYVPPQKITATVVTRKSLHEYEIRDLRVDGARLVGGPRLPVRRAFEIIVSVPYYPAIRLHARVDPPPAGATHGMWITFIHTSDYTEDHIQAALLSELERRRPN